MTCAKSKVLLHALLDGKLNAGHAREVEKDLECARAARPNCVLIANCSKPSRPQSCALRRQ
jgi:hypothetical protein